MRSIRVFALILLTAPLIFTIAAILNPLTLYSYDGRACSKVEFYFGTFKVGSIELTLREVQNSSALLLSRSYNMPITYLPERIPFVGIRCKVNKTLETPPPGAPEDTVGVGLVVRLPDGSSSLLLCSAAPTDYTTHRISESLGDIYECTSSRIWSEISSLRNNSVSASFLTEDFIPAFMLMVKKKRFSLLDVEVVGVYVLSDTIVSNEGGRFLEVTTSGILGYFGSSPSYILVNGTAIPLKYGLARVHAFRGLYTVGIEFSSPLFLPSKKVELPIEL